MADHQLIKTLTHTNKITSTADSFRRCQYLKEKKVTKKSKRNRKVKRTLILDFLSGQKGTTVNSKCYSSGTSPEVNGLTL